jgi:hypothetical protein
MANAAEKTEQDDAAASGPPVERASAIWTRRFVILAFWAVVVCLGLPLWTWTTTIHRSELPLESMNAWAEGRVRLTILSRLHEVYSANICGRPVNSVFHFRYPYLPAAGVQTSRENCLLELKMCSIARTPDRCTLSTLVLTRLVTRLHSRSN